MFKLYKRNLFFSKRISIVQSKYDVTDPVLGFICVIRLKRGRPNWSNLIYILNIILKTNSNSIYIFHYVTIKRNTDYRNKTSTSIFPITEVRYLCNILLTEYFGT